MSACRPTNGKVPLQIGIKQGVPSGSGVVKP
jgi:hypothetical protein